MGSKLWLFWRENVGFEVVGMSAQLITAWFSSLESKIMVTFVYAKCSQMERQVLWSSLEDINVKNCP